MVSEIVILPTCFSEKNISSELIQVLKDVYNHPIFIVDFENSNWIKEIKDIDSNEGIPDPLRKALQVFFKKIRNRIILKESSQTDFSKIINWFKKIKLHSNINCVFITNNDFTLCKKQHIDFYQKIEDVILVDSTKWDSIKNSGVEIKKTENETEKILKTICENTDKVILVDGYFTPTKRNTKRTLHLISKNLGQNIEYKSEDKKILIHATTKMTSDIDMLKHNIQEELVKFKAKYNIEYEFYLWDYIHDRSFLTDKVCLESTSGMEIIDDDSKGDNITTKWLLLSHNVANEQLDKYDVCFDDDIENVIWRYST